MPRTRTRHILLLSALCIALASAAAPTARAQAQNDTDWKQGKWGHLAQYIGTYKIDTVLADPEVKAKLDALLDEDKQKIFRANIAVAAPIGFDNDCLYTIGNAEKAGPSETAYVSVCLYAGKVNVGIHSDSETTIYTADNSYAYLPLSMRTWAYTSGNPREYQTKPAQVQMITAGQK